MGLVILRPRSGSGEQFRARILPGQPLRLALGKSGRVVSENIPYLLEEYQIVSATDEERAALAAAGISIRAH